MDIAYLMEGLNRIEAKEGKYAVIGNHDYGGGAFRIYEDFMNDCGFQVLKDETIIFEKYNFEMIGFDDYLLGQTAPDSYNIQSDKFHLIIAHEPVISQMIECHGNNFILSGHTHGGQVFIPFFTKIMLPKGSDQFVKGFYAMNDIGSDATVQMYVSSGIGVTKYPFRLFNVPEMIVVNLIGKE